eukprot:349640-Chlamydomonas_euryale.AAC.3
MAVITDKDRLSIRRRLAMGTSRLQGGVGTGWLRTVRSGMPFVTVPCPLLDPLCHATLNTGIPFVGPLPVTLTLTCNGATGNRGLYVSM